MTKQSLRIGTGAGFSSDRLEPAVDLARDGELDVLVFETIGERTLAFGHRDRRADAARGYNPHLAARMRAVLPHTTANGTCIITNMGVANPVAAAEVVLGTARDLGLTSLRVAIVEGDDVSHLIDADTVLLDNGNTQVGDISSDLICANAYIGADAILPALDAEADVIITGRVADPSMFLAPLMHTFGWAADDWDALGQGTLIGHLMECGMQITGGYFADPGFKDVPDLANCGYPIAEVDADGCVTITKLATSGGLVSERTVKEQLLYEVHDPAAYLTPDVTADFASVRIEETGADRVSVTGGRGRERPETLKATVAFDGGLLAEAGVSYAGPGAVARAELARDILRDRLTRLVGAAGPLRFDIIGVDALHQTAGTGQQTVTHAPSDVRLRVAQRTPDRESAEMVLWETEALLCCGPAGGGGYRGRISPSVVTHSALLPRDRIETRVTVRDL